MVHTLDLLKCMGYSLFRGVEMELKELYVDQDLLTIYIKSKLKAENISVSTDVIEKILELEMNFLIEKGIAEV